MVISTQADCPSDGFNSIVYTNGTLPFTVRHTGHSKGAAHVTLGPGLG